MTSWRLLAQVTEDARVEYRLWPTTGEQSSEPPSYRYRVVRRDGSRLLFRSMRAVTWFLSGPDGPGADDTGSADRTRQESSDRANQAPVRLPNVGS